MPLYILILTNTYSNVKSDTLKILLSNLIILSDLLHHLVHHFHIKLHHFMIQYTTLPFFKILQNISKYKGLRSYINLWKSIVRKSINSCLYCSIFLKPPYLWTSVCPCKSVKSSQFYHKFPVISIEELSSPLKPIFAISPVTTSAQISDAFSQFCSKFCTPTCSSVSVIVRTDKNGI